MKMFLNGKVRILFLHNNVLFFKVWRNNLLFIIGGKREGGRFQTKSENI